MDAGTPGERRDGTDQAHAARLRTPALPNGLMRTAEPGIEGNVQPDLGRAARRASSLVEVGISAAVGNAFVESVGGTWSTLVMGGTYHAMQGAVSFSAARRTNSTQASVSFSMITSVIPPPWSPRDDHLQGVLRAMRFRSRRALIDPRLHSTRSTASVPAAA